MGVPYGYAKDSKAVYYENFVGKIKVLKKADPVTFVSNDDGYFGWDAKHFYIQTLTGKDEPYPRPLRLCAG